MIVDAPFTVTASDVLPEHVTVLEVCDAYERAFFWKHGPFSTLQELRARYLVHNRHQCDVCIDAERSAPAPAAKPEIIDERNLFEANIW